MEEASPHFIEIFDNDLVPAAWVCVGVAVVILLYHEFRVLRIKDYKEKYDYVNANEVRFFWYAMVALIIGFALYLNHLAASVSMSVFNDQTTWFYVRGFMTLCLVAILYVIFNSLVRIYYPRFVERRLEKLMNKPRISPDGNVMRKLAEEEEEAHLEAWQFQEQQEIHSVDYVVWLDEKTGYKKIEKYETYKHIIECPDCGFVTMKMISEEVVQPPTAEETGIVAQRYKCTYCEHRLLREKVLARLPQDVTA